MASMEQDIEDKVGETYRSLTVLRAHHLELMRAVRAEKPGKELAGRVQQFLKHAQATGRVLDSLSERDAAQDILDYWTAWLITSDADPEAASGPILLAELDLSRAPDLAGTTNPFQGLQPFAENDEGRFLGRSEAIRDLLHKVLHHALVFVTGPLGSGKTSVVMAGVLPRLRTRLAIDGKEPIVAVVIPGTDPLGALLRAIYEASGSAGLPPLGTWVDEQKNVLQRAPNQLGEIIEAVAPSRPVVIVVDQFEEIFSLNVETAAKEQFAQAIASLGQDPPAKNRVILIIRQDYSQQVNQLSALKEFAQLSDAHFSPPPLSGSELLHVIRSVAAEAGLKFDEGIAEDLANEAAGNAAALPTLQFTLSKLWQDRKHNRITWDIYTAVGRPREALKRAAEGALLHLTPEEQETAQKVFLELVEPTGEENFLRRRVRRETLLRLDESAKVTRVLDQFVESGLLRKTQGVEPEDDRFEVAHEALVHGWDRLAKWLNEARQKSQERWQFVAKARLYQQHRDPAYLLRGQALHDAEKYADTAPELRELVNQSKNAAERRTNILFWVPVGLVVGALLAFAVYESHDEYYVPYWDKRINNSLNATDEDIEWLARKRVKLNLARLVRSGSDFHGLKSDSAKFTGAQLLAVEFSHAILPGAIFTQSTISHGSFERADLTYARFDGANITQTNFVGAQLARVTFDRANLRGVTFSGAEIEEASFRDVVIDHSLAGFAGTAWWLAVGWTDSQIDKLDREHSRQTYLESKFFQDQRAKSEARIEVARTANDKASAWKNLAWFLAIQGEIERTANDKAFALNDLAWLLATHGTELPTAEQAIREALNTFVPDAKSQALSDTWNANFQDTLGYILLQQAINTDDEGAAKDLLQRAKEAFSASVLKVPSGEHLFRYALNLFYLDERDSALAFFEHAIRQGYAPSHERYLLRQSKWADLQQVIAKACENVGKCY